MNLIVEVYSEQLDQMVACEVVAEIHDNPEHILGMDKFLDLDVYATYLAGDKLKTPVDLSVLNEEDLSRVVCNELNSL